MNTCRSGVLSDSALDSSLRQTRQIGAWVSLRSTPVDCNPHRHILLWVGAMHGRIVAVDRNARRGWSCWKSSIPAVAAVTLPAAAIAVWTSAARVHTERKARVDMRRMKAEGRRMKKMVGAEGRGYARPRVWELLEVSRHSPE